MRATDTNIVARYLLNDDPEQAEAARGIIEAGAFLPVTVILELGWLLGSRYRFPRDAIAAMLRYVLDLPSVTVLDRRLVGWAIDRYAASGDLADLLHLAGTGPAESFVTFDAGIAGAAGSDTPIPIETLA